MELTHNRMPRTIKKREVIMKIKSWLKYFIYILLILIMVFWGQHVLAVIRENAKRNFNACYPYIITTIFYVGIGLLLGLEHLISEIKKEGVWKLNLPKIILMVVPSLYFSFGIFIYYNNLTVLSFPIGILMKNGTNFISIFQLILGYSIITSFYKADREILLFHNH